MKQKLIYILALSIAAIVAVYTFQLYNNDGKNGFNRKFENLDLNVTKTFPLPPGLSYFSGISDQTIYFQNLSNKTALYSLNYSLSKFMVKELEFPSDTQISRIIRADVNVFNSVVYAVNVQTGKLNLFPMEGNGNLVAKSPKLHLDHSKPISKESIVGKSVLLKNGKLQTQLTKVNYVKGTIDTTYVFENQKDGLFVPDGMLQFDSSTSRILYTYFYSGQFLCLDTNLKLLYKSKTVDTITTATVKVVKLEKQVGKKKQTTITQSGAPKFVNHNFTIRNGYIYILSGLKADNEQTASFNRNNVIDVYAIDNGKYLYSFYIPKYKSQRMREFRIADGYIFATFGGDLVSFKLKNKTI